MHGEGLSLRGRGWAIIGAGLGAQAQLRLREGLRGPLTGTAWVARRRHDSYGLGGVAACGSRFRCAAPSGANEGVCLLCRFYGNALFAEVARANLGRSRETIAAVIRDAPRTTQGPFWAT